MMPKATVTLFNIPVPEELDLSYALLMRNLVQGQDTRNPTGK